MRPAAKISEADYLRLEADSDVKHEFVNGELVAMAGASPRHNQLVANALAALKARLAGRGCYVVAADQRTRVDETGLYAYPDLTATCEPPRFRLEPRPATLLNPNLVVEVLSTTTEAWDRGGKAAHFRALPSVREYVLVSQAERRVEVFRRADDGAWLFVEVVGTGTVRLESVGVDLPLDEIYEGADELPGDEATG